MPYKLLFTARHSCYASVPVSVYSVYSRAAFFTAATPTPSLCSRSAWAYISLQIASCFLIHNVHYGASCCIVFSRARPIMALCLKNLAHFVGWGVLRPASHRIGRSVAARPPSVTAVQPHAALAPLLRNSQR